MENTEADELLGKMEGDARSGREFRPTLLRAGNKKKQKHKKSDAGLGIINRNSLILQISLLAVE